MLSNLQCGLRWPCLNASTLHEHNCAEHNCPAVDSVPFYACYKHRC
jgi:hypothetical protein